MGLFGSRTKLSSIMLNLIDGKLELKLDKLKEITDLQHLVIRISAKYKLYVAIAVQPLDELFTLSNFEYALPISYILYGV